MPHSKRFFYCDYRNIRVIQPAKIAKIAKMDRPPPEPMTLGNMRANGVHSLFVYCDRCHHEAIMNVDHYSAAIPVPAFGPRMVCTRCGAIGADARPDWREKR